jgi:hypothetical protein
LLISMGGMISPATSPLVSCGPFSGRFDCSRKSSQAIGLVMAVPGIEDRG